MTLADSRLALRARLLGDSAIAAIISTRIYPGKMPQGVVDTSIVYNRVSGLGDVHSGGPSGLARPRFQVDCWSASADTAAALAQLVKDRLDGFSGAVAWDDSSPGNSITVQGVFFDTERDAYDDAIKMYGVSQDYLVWLEER